MKSFYVVQLKWQGSWQQSKDYEMAIGKIKIQLIQVGLVAVHIQVDLYFTSIK
jgi:hypothetical protein